MGTFWWNKFANLGYTYLSNRCPKTVTYRLKKSVDSVADSESITALFLCNNFAIFLEIIVCLSNSFCNTCLWLLTEGAWLLLLFYHQFICLRLLLKLAMQPTHEDVLNHIVNTDMEDAHTHILSLPGDQNACFFGVFDGHGGWFRSFFSHFFASCRFVTKT